MTEITVNMILEKQIKKYQPFFSKPLEERFYQEMTSIVPERNETNSPSKWKEKVENLAYHWIQKNFRKQLESNPNFLTDYFLTGWKPENYFFKLNEFISFLQQMDYYPNLEFYLSLLDQYPPLVAALESIVKVRENSISSKDLEKIPSYANLSSLIEAYLTFKDIDITMEEEDWEEETSTTRVGTDIIKVYLNNIRIPVLSREEERDLFLALEAGDEKAFNTIAEHSLRLVVSIAKTKVGRGLELADLIQEGNLGLLKAIEKYDVHLGYKFSTYASWWIRQTIDRAIADLSSTIRRPVHVVDATRKLLKIQGRLSAQLMREPTIEELAEESGFSTKKVTSLLQGTNNVVSLQTLVRDDGDTELEDFLPDTSNPYESFENMELKKNLLEAMQVCGLSPREKNVIVLRFGLDTGVGRTLEAVGQRLNLTRERVRQIEDKALRKLRTPRGKKLLNDFRATPDEKIPFATISLDIKRDYARGDRMQEKKITDYLKETNMERIMQKVSQLQYEYQQILYAKFGRTLERPGKPLNASDEFLFQEGILPMLRNLLMEKPAKEERTTVKKKVSVTTPRKASIPSETKVIENCAVQLPEKRQEEIVTLPQGKEEERKVMVKNQEKREKDKTSIPVETTQKEKKTRRSLKTIYIYFKEESEQAVDAAISTLLPKEKAILDRLYGEDYHQPVKGTITNSERTYLHRVVLPKMARVIAAGKGISDSIQKELVPSPTFRVSSPSLDNFLASVPIPQEQFTKQDYEVLRTYLQREEFQQALQTLSLEEAVITALSLSLVGNKKMLPSEIAPLLGMTEEEVRQACQRGLFKLKETFDQAIEEAKDSYEKKLGGMTSHGKKE